MKKINKKVINNLEEYFSKQDIKIISRALANAFLDIHRVIYIKSLPLDESYSLFQRSKKNSEELVRFAENGEKGNFKLNEYKS